MAAKFLIGTGNWSADTIWSTTDGGANDTTHPIDGDAVSCTAASGAVTLTVDVSSAATSLTCTGFTGTFDGSAALQLKGNLLAVAGMTYSYTGTLTIANTTGTATLTSGGQTLCGALTQNGAGGTLTFADAFVTTGTCTLTAGTWNDGNVNLTMAAWVAGTGTATRVTTYGTTNVWEITGSGTCFTYGGTGWSANAAVPISVIYFSYSGASARTIARQNGGHMPNVRVGAGSGGILFDKAPNFYSAQINGNLDFTTYSGAATFNGTAVEGGALIVNGGTVTLSVTGTYTATAGGDFALHNGSYITSNGATLNANVVVNRLGLTLNDALTVSGSLRVGVSTTNLPVFNAANFNVTCATFDSSNTNTRTITMGSGTWTLTSTAATTVWNMATTTGLTLNANTATIDLTGVTANTRTISSNSLVMPSVTVSAGSGAVTFTNANYNNLTFGNSYSGTIANQTITIRGSVQLSNHASFALTAGANAWTFTSIVPQTITSNGKTIDFPLTFNGALSTGSWTFADNFTHGVTRTLTLTTGTINCGIGLTHTMGFFSSLSSNIRAFNTGTSLLNFPTTGTIWFISSATGLIVSGTGTIWLSNNSATARTLSAGSVNINMPNLLMDTGSYSPTFTNCNFRNVTITSGYTGTIANQTISIWGNIDIAATGAILSAGTNVWTWHNGIGGVATWISNSRVFDFPITINGPSQIHQLADNFSMGVTRTLTLTAGTIHFGTGLTHTLGAAFSSSNSNTRTINSGTSTIILPGTGTVYDTSTSTNLTVTGSGTLKLTDSSATARAITAGTKRIPGLWVSAGTSTTTLTNVTGCQDLNTTGMAAGTILAGSAAFAIGGSLTFTADTTWSYTGALTFDTTSIGKTITTAGKTLTTSTVSFNGSGGEWVLQDTLTLSNTAVTITAGSLNSNGQSTNIATLLVNNTSGTVTLSSGATTWTTDITQNGVGGTFSLGDALTATSITLTNGTLDTNSVAVATSSFSSSNSNTRELQLGSTTWTLSGAGTPWNCATSTNLTVTPGTSTIKMTNATATFAGGGKTYNNVWFNSAAGTYNVTGSNIFKDLKVAG